jgi:uncharacterized protein with von Willebrand factor type A (vWA) domain
MVDLQSFKQDLYQQAMNASNLDDTLIPHFDNFLNQELDDLMPDVQRTLDQDFPYQASQSRLEALLDSQDCGRKYREQLSNGYQSFCQQSGQSFDDTFWHENLMLTEDAPQTLHSHQRDSVEVTTQLIKTRWQEDLDKTRAQWELQTLNEQRAAFLKRIQQNMNALEDVHDALDDLGLEPGLWMDLGDGKLTKQQIESFKRWAEYFKNDPNLQAICDMLGRMQQQDISEKIQKIKQSEQIHTWVPDKQAKEKLVGFKFGQDIAQTLTSELSLLSLDETELLFNLKYAEATLMNYDMEGSRRVSSDIEKLVEASVTEEDNQGPLILCVDTSGSMIGAPETVAKAAALFLATKAKENKRACYLISFSTDINTFDFNGSKGLGNLIDFLGSSFHGGTDITPALQHTLEVMKKETYEKADALVISDFVMGSLPSSIQAGMKQQRQTQKNRFHSLVIDNHSMDSQLRTVFDNEWVYDPHSGKIQELLSIANTLG